MVGVVLGVLVVGAVVVVVVVDVVIVWLGEVDGKESMWFVILSVFAPVTSGKGEREISLVSLI